MSNLLLFVIIILYLCVIFGVAYFTEKRKNNKWLNNGYIYALSLAVYCTAWTYYGSIGIAASSGADFLPIYLGPVIAAPFFVIILEKVIRISKQHQVSSIADFISLRYGNNRFVGALVTVVCLIGVVPYISLQLKAISETFTIMVSKTNLVSQTIWNDSTFYVALILAVFATFFGTQTSDASEKRRGIIVTVAMESVIKLVFFLVIGIYVTYYLFNGTTDIYNQIAQTPNFENLTKVDGFEKGLNWLYVNSLSFCAIFLLPRQFQVAVVENVRKKHLYKAIWVFPLYLLLFNVFVIFIAWAGKLTFSEMPVSEYYALLLPLKHGDTFMALLVFLGGFSAVISMVVVATIALATMVSNNLVIPYGFLDRFQRNNPSSNVKYIKGIRRISIFTIILLSYSFYQTYSYQMSLYSIGLIAFVIIAQLAPSFFLGLFWNRGSSKASIISILVGMLIVFYTLVLPFTLEGLFEHETFISKGPMEIAFLKPHALFGVDYLSPPAHAFFWSILFNLMAYAITSVVIKGDYRERNYAEMFVDNENYSLLQDGALVWKGEAYVDDIKRMLIRFLGEQQTKKQLKSFFTKYNLPESSAKADARLIRFSERLLTGIIGSASAKILVSSVVKEEKVSLVEVLKILEESKLAHQESEVLKEQSGQLTLLSNSLQKANEQLIEKDKQKDEFLDTVAHELKTPITGIRATTELLLDDLDEMPETLKLQFLQNILNDSERLSRLIQNILDFEKLSTRRSDLNLTKQSIQKTIDKAMNTVVLMAGKKQIQLISTNTSDYEFYFDEDKIVQVLTNLLSNAIKFCEPKVGEIIIDYKYNESHIEVFVKDNGKGIPNEDISYIFDKFYQSKNQNTIKPSGSGLGLAISKQIIEMHEGKIWVKTNKKAGVTFGFKLPFL